jgi:hypothetical protein
MSLKGAGAAESACPVGAIAARKRKVTNVYAGFSMNSKAMP